MSEPKSQQQQAFFGRLADPTTLLRLFDLAPGIYLYVKDIDGCFIAVNQALVAMRRARSEDELVGKTDLDIHPTYWGERYRNEDRHVIESGRAIVNQVWLVPDAHGRLGTFVSSKIPLFDADGICMGIAGVMHRVDSYGSEASEPPLEKATQLIAERYS